MDDEVHRGKGRERERRIEWGKKLVSPVVSFINQKYTSIQGCLFHISKWNFLYTVVFLLKVSTDTKVGRLDKSNEDVGHFSSYMTVKYFLDLK